MTLDFFQGVLKIFPQSVGLMIGVVPDSFHFFHDQLELLKYDSLLLRQAQIFLVGLMRGIRVRHIDREDLLIVVTSLNVARDDALGAEGLTRFSVEEFVPLLVLWALAEISELLLLLISWDLHMALQDATVVELGVAIVAEKLLVIDAVDGGGSWLPKLVSIDALGEGTFSIHGLFDWIRDIDLASHLVQESTPLFIKDTVEV